MILGIVPDGNRRWATTNGLKPWDGHRQGAELLKKVLEKLYERKDVNAAVIYMFSHNNFKRTQREILELFKIFYEYFKEIAKDILTNGAKATIEFIGDYNRFPYRLQQIFDKLVYISQGCEKKVYFVVNYTPGITPPPQIGLDLLIRTGNQNRLSGFIPECMAESEIIFRKEMWPEYTTKKLENDIKRFYSVERRTGA